jgi:cytochrome P450
VDVQFAEVAYQAWGGQNDLRQPWDQDPEMSSVGRLGFNADNLFSTTKAKDGVRLRRLVGPPFAKKFLQDQEQIFKDCAKRAMEKMKRLAETNDDKVDVLMEYKNYTMDVVSMFVISKKELICSRIFVWGIFQRRFNSTWSDIGSIA